MSVPSLESQSLLRSLTELRGVGPAMLEKLARLGLHTVQDVLFHLPTRYQDRTRVVPIGAALPGAELVVIGEILHTEVVFRRRRMLLCKVSDGSGSMTLRFFHFNEKQRQGMRTGCQLHCFGEVRGNPGALEMIHPEYRIQADTEPVSVEEHLTPIYPTTDGVNQLTLRRLVAQVLPCVGRVVELLPSVAAAGAVPELADALRYLHQPPPEAAQALLLEGEHPAQQRLIIEELVAHQLSLLRIRQTVTTRAAPVFDGDVKPLRAFRDQLPFALTAAQQRVLDEIRSDLVSGRPMMRLVQGDVGSGKTIVAAIACLQAVSAGFQAVVMAPTEILAEQHLQNFRCWFEPLGFTIAWHSGKAKAAARRENRRLTASGEAQFVVGTHALFQDDVSFHRLGLVVVDEQHRFGVHQRMALRDKGSPEDGMAHQLSMTATPIPRTLAQTAYADLDLSVIDELPPGRQPVNTVAMGNDRRAQIVEHVAQACRDEGRQCYWVCTLVEESEVLQAEAAEGTYADLQQALPDLRLGLVHGRMKADEKQEVMAAFKAGELQLLVATTVIEVGVDVRNATLMIIENAERLGLSQLHQLRGRVGRGTGQSSCVLLYQHPLSKTGRKRIQAMRDTNDGFRIAQIDLELRGPGELLGTRQTGLMQFRVADLVRDESLIPVASELARRIVAQYPEHIDPLIARWIGERLQYQNV